MRVNVSNNKLMQGSFSYRNKDKKTEINKSNKTDIDQNKLDKMLVSNKSEKLGYSNVKLEISANFELAKNDIDDSAKVSYKDIFNSKITSEQIDKLGVSNKAKEVYYNSVENSNGVVSVRGDMSFDDKLKDSVEKYDSLAKVIKEEFGHVPIKFNSEMEKLNKAFEVNTRSIIDNGKVDTSLLNLINEKKSLLNGNKISGATSNAITNDNSYRHTDEVAKKFAESFISAYKNNKEGSTEDLIKLAENLIENSFPTETTSIDSISYIDFQIISNTKESFYNKGTGMDILNSLANNKDLSEELRNGFNKIVEGENIYGSTFHAMM